MAEDESFLEFLDESNDHICHRIVKLQAMIRGWRVRRQLAKIQRLFQNIVTDIEGDNVEVSWSTRNYVSKPLIVRQRRGKMKEQNRLKGVESWHQNVSSRSKTPDIDSATEKIERRSRSVLNVSSESCEQKICAENSGQRLTSVDTQTEVVNVTDEKDFKPPELQNISQSSDKNPSVSLAVQTEFLNPENDKDENKKIEQNSSFHLQKDDEIADLALLSSTENDQFLSEKRTAQESTKEVCEIETGVDLSENYVEKLCDNGQDTVNEKNLRSPGSDNSTNKDNGATEDDIRLEDKLSKLPNSKTELEDLRNTTAMELLWVQQAINSRKHYLRLRQQLS